MLPERGVKGFGQAFLKACGNPKGKARGLHTLPMRKRFHSFRSQRKEKKMRLDKFLKVSRIIKRRTVANEACDAGRILAGGKPARASYEVKPGDILEIGVGRPMKVRVLSVNEYATKENASEMYEILPEEK